MIGNPPYISAPAQIATPHLSEQRQRLINSKCYKSLYQKWDLYIPFIERAIRYLCAKDRIMTMIVPYPLTNQLYAKSIRKILTTEFNIFELVDLNGTKIFENATVNTCIIFVKKQVAKNTLYISDIDDMLKISHNFKKSYKSLIQDKDTVVWNLSNEKGSQHQYANMYTLGDFCYISVGMVLNADEKKAKGEFTKDDLISINKDCIHCKKYIEAKDIEKYRINRTRYLEYGTTRMPSKIRRATFSELYLSKKIILNCLGTINATFDNDGYYHNHSIYAIVLWDSISDIHNKSILSSIKKFSTKSRSQMEKLSKGVNLRYLLGILNSKYASILLANLRGGDYHIYPEHIRNIPIPSVSKEQQQPIINLVDQILIAKKKNSHADTSLLEGQIDQLVYKLYDLTQEEINNIEQNKG